MDLATLKVESEIREKYRVADKNRFQTLEGMEEVEDEWEALKTAISVSATEIIRKVEKKTKQNWMTQESLDLMEERRKAKAETEKCEKVHETIKKKCNEAKESWLVDKCRDIDIFRRYDPSRMYQNIEEIVGRKIVSSSGCLKDKHGNIIMERDKILAR